MITDEMINKWREKTIKASFETVVEHGMIPPYAFFFTSQDPMYVAVELQGSNSMIHRMVISSICQQMGCLAYIVIYASNFVVSRASISQLRNEVDQAGGVSEHVDAKNGIVVIFETQCITRHQVFEYVESEDGTSIVLDDKPIMDTIPYSSAYANILNHSKSMKDLMN